MACRSTDKAASALEEIKKECQGEENLGEIIVVRLDLNSLTSIRKCAEDILSTEEKINLLINNAGVMACPFGRTEDGFEIQFGTNHLGHFLFTMLLLPKIIQSTPARIVNVSSLGHIDGRMDFDDLNWEKRSYSPTQAYCRSKLANILFTRELARKIKEADIEGLTVYSLHPGVINTDLARHLDDSYFRGARCIATSGVAKFFMKTPEEGAYTSIYCAVDEKSGKETGLYYSDCKVKEPSSRAKKDGDAKKLWEVSLKLVNLDEDYDPFKLNHKY